MDRETAELLDRASALRQSGRTEEAIAAYEQLLARDPGLSESWFNLGWLQRQARRYESSLASYQQAIDRGVSGPEEAHLNRAVILSDHLARPGDAEAELRAALALNPRYVPALLNLGNLHEDRGERAEAEAAYRQALDIDPASALAMSRLAGVLDPRSDDAGRLVVSLRRAIAAAATPGERADLGFALVRLLDGRGDHEEAFAAASAANRASRDSFGPGFPGYDRAAQESFVERSIAAVALPASAPGGEEAPIFIIGMFRSGSTLVEQILAGHSGVAAGGELDLIPALTARISGYPGSVGKAAPEDIDSMREFYLAGAAPFARSGARLTDKRPDNFLHLGLVKTLFPNAKIVHTKRERNDNLLSLHFLHLGPAMPYALDLADSAHWHAQYERLMAHWKRLYPGDIFDVDYDLLVREPEPLLERLLDFLELPREDGLLDFHSRDSTVKTASVWQVREPLHARSSGRWRNYREQLDRALGE